MVAKIYIYAMKKLALLLLIFSLSACDVLEQVAKDSARLGPPSKSEISQGIREALIVGATNAVLQTSKENGFYGNQLIKIPFPPEAQKVASTLNDLGFNKQVDQFVETMNHAAEKAAEKAKPIFVKAIKQMTLRDVYDIWRGDDDAATQFLKRTTTNALKAEFRPVIQNAINQVELTKHWNPVITTYNQIPFTTKVNPNLDEYILDETLNGLFTVIAKEEEKIRENPSARVSAILQRVFGYSAGNATP